MNLKVESEKLAKSRIKLSVTLPKKELDKFRSLALEKINNQIEIPGFRKGKAPKNRVIERVGATRVDSEALDLALPQTSALAMAREKIFPVAQPKVTIKQFEKEKDLIYELEAEIMPKITAPVYKNLNVKKEKAKVTEKELEESLKKLQKQMANYTDKKDKIEKGDWVEMDFEGTINGVKKDKLCSKHFPFVIGETKFIDGFEKELVGMKEKGEKEFDLNLPNDIPDKDLAGKKAKFKVKINGVKVIHLPKIDKEFAKKLAAKDVIDLKKRFRKALLGQKEAEILNQYKNNLVEAVIKKIKIDIPQGLLDNESSRLINEFTKGLNMSGTNVEEYLKRTNKSKEEFDKDIKTQAEKNIKIGLALSEISKKEKVKVKEDEIKDETQKLVNEGMQQGAKKSELLKNFESEDGKRYLENVIRNRKTIDRIVELNIK